MVFHRRHVLPKCLRKTHVIELLVPFWQAPEQPSLRILLRPDRGVHGTFPGRTTLRVNSVTSSWLDVTRTKKGLSKDRPFFVSGGADRGRTDDLMNAIHALYQLSYGPSKRGAVPSTGSSVRQVHSSQKRVRRLNTASRTESSGLRVLFIEFLQGALTLFFDTRLGDGASVSVVGCRVRAEHLRQDLTRSPEVSLCGIVRG